MADEYCTDCKSNTLVVFDNNSGDTICSECGLVLESHYINETAEWRTFADARYFEERDPTRLGIPTNPPLPIGGLGTSIGKESGTSNEDGNKKWQCKNEKDTHLMHAFMTMDMMADNLKLVQSIKDYAKEMYKKADNEKILGKSKITKAIMVACLYLACQEVGFPRTFKEVYSIADGARVKDVHKAILVLKRQLEVGRKTIHAKDIARRFCSNLGLNNHTIKVVQEAVQRIEELDIRRNQTSILGAVIYMVSQLSENKIKLPDIAKVTKVGEPTLMSTYRDIYPYASVLIPSWYAKAEDVVRLCNL